MRLIDADKMATDELAAFISAQAKITDVANRDINSIVHEKIQRLIADTPTVENVEQVVQCKDCLHFEGATANAKGFLICPNTGMDIWDECYCAHGERRIIEPQPDGIQFRTVDDLGRICIPKDIRDKLGIEPGTECAVYATDELTNKEIIVIRRKKNDKTNQVGT